MPPKKPESSLPFLTREMLNFEHGVAFGLRLYFQSATTATLTIRGMTREGVFTLKIPITKATSGTEINNRIPDIPIIVSMYLDAGDATQGEVWASLNLTANGDVLASLCSGYIYGGKGITYPMQSITDQRPGGGFVDAVIGSDPAANTEIAETCPVGQAWDLIGTRVTLVTDATVANRRVHMEIIPEGASTGMHFFSNTDQAASTTKLYSFAAYGTIPAETDDNVICVNIPPNLKITSRTTIRIYAKNMAAGDNFGAPAFYVEQTFNELF